MKFLLFMLMAGSITSHAEGILVSCFSDRVSGKIEVFLPNAKTDVSNVELKGEFLSKEFGAIPFSAVISTDSSGRFQMVHGVLEVLNPYLGVMENIEQTSGTYVEVQILKNRVRGSDGGYIFRAGDQYGFGIHCATRQK